MLHVYQDHNQLMFTCLILTVERLEKGVRYVQSKQ